MFTKDDVLKTLKEVVKGKEDYIYKRPERRAKHGGNACFYTTPEGAPSCIVGYVIARLDPELLQEIKGYEDRNRQSFPFSPYTKVARNPLNKVKAEFEPDAIILLQRAQTEQDAGNTWGEALEYAVS